MIIILSFSEPILQSLVYIVTLKKKLVCAHQACWYMPVCTSLRAQYSEGQDRESQVQGWSKTVRSEHPLNHTIVHRPGKTKGEELLPCW